MCWGLFCWRWLWLKIKFFLDVIKKQELEKDRLTEEIIKLKKQLRDANVNMEIAKASSNSTPVNNVDILKRISNLEKVIFGKDE